MKRKNEVSITADCTAAVAEARDCLRAVWNCHYRHLATTADVWEVHGILERRSAEIIVDVCIARCAALTEEIAALGVFRDKAGVEIRGHIGASLPASFVQWCTVKPDTPPTHWADATDRDLYLGRDMRLTTFDDYDLTELRDFHFAVLTACEPSEDGRFLQCRVGFQFCSFSLHLSM